jgi:hypothetical protein
MNKLEKKHYVLAAYCYIHAILQIPERKYKDETEDILDDLGRYFYNIKDIEDKYRFLCEKATFYSIFGGCSAMKFQRGWKELLARKKGLPTLSISGQKILSLKNKNQQMLTAMNTVTSTLVQYLVDPTEDKIEDCKATLAEQGTLPWMEYFFKSLSQNPTNDEKAKSN